MKIKFTPITRLFAVFALLVAAVFGSQSFSTTPARAAGTPYEITLPTGPHPEGYNCGGSYTIEYFDYYPEPNDTHYILNFDAQSDSPATVDMAMPLGYEDSVSIPASGSFATYTVTVDTPNPAPGARLPILIFTGVNGPCWTQDADLTIQNMHLYVER